MATLKTVLEKFEKVMAAVAFAEAGEFREARQWLQADKTTNKRVLLGTEQEEIDEKMVRHAIELCRRIGGKLEVFHMFRSSQEESDKIEKELLEQKPLLTDWKTKLQQKGIYYQVAVGPDCLADALSGYVQTRRDILCVVFDNTQQGNRCRQAKEKLLTTLQKIKCPIVMYG